MRNRVSLLFFLSGFTALIYEVVWARQLGLVFGTTTEIVSAILTVFFFGLASGSFFWGRKIDKSRHPLRLYAMLEVAVGLYALLTPFLFSRLIGLQFVSPYLLVFASLILPTFMIGGTFPVFCKVLSINDKKKVNFPGQLYGLNTLGSVLGALSAGFLLLPNIGIRGTVWTAAIVDLLIGLTALLMSLKSASIPSSQELAVARNEPLDKKVVFFFTLCGFAALSLEVLWTRVLVLTFGSSTYAFSAILVIFLLGLALGSMIGTRFFSKYHPPIEWLTVLALVLAASVVWLTLLLGRLPIIYLNLFPRQLSFQTSLWPLFVLSALVLGLPTLLMGVIASLVLKTNTGNQTFIGRNIGWIYAANTLGGVAGAFVAGAIFLRYFGLQKGIYISSLFYLAAGLILLFQTSWKPKSRLVVLLLAITAAGSFFLLPEWSRGVLSSGVFIDPEKYLESKTVKAEMEKGKTLYDFDGKSATVLVKEDPDNLYLKINGKTDASTANDRESFMLIGHLPLLLHPDPKEILLVGLGAGLSLGAVEQHPVQNIDVVEIEPAVVEAAKFFAKDNHNALRDPRLKIIINDGRHYLQTTSKKYDVISSHPSNIWIAGETNLFTKEYYELAASHLSDNGLMLHWIQIYHLADKDFKTTLATFCTVFQACSLWMSPYSKDLLLIGANGHAKINFAALKDAFKQEKVSLDLAELEINEPAQLLSHFIASDGKIREFVKGSTINSDDRPVLEFSSPLALTADTIDENLEALLVLQEAPFTLIDNLTATEKVKTERYLALKENIFKAQIALARGDRENSIKFTEEALKSNPEIKRIKQELGLIYFHLAQESFMNGNLPEAKVNLLKSAEYDPDQPLVHLNLGSLYYASGDLFKALEEWQITERLDPENLEVRQNLDLLKENLPKSR